MTETAHSHTARTSTAHEDAPVGPSAAGSVVLELGGDVGVLVLHATAALLGREIEISRVGCGTESGTGSGTAGRTHSLVRERSTAAGTRYAAVYPGLAVGRYTVWRDPDTPAGAVTVHGGQVARFRWPD